MKQILIFILSLNLAWAQSTIIGPSALVGPIIVVGGNGPVAPTVLQTCGGSGGAGTATCAFGSNLTSGSRVYLAGEDFSANSTTLSGSGAGCNSPTFTTDNDSSNFIIQSTMDGTSAGGACTITYTGSGNITLYGLEVAGSTGGIDTRAAPVCQNSCMSITTGTAFNCPNISTAGAQELVVCAAWDTGGNSGTYTAGTGFTVKVGATSNSFGTGIEVKAQATSGSITPTYNSYSASTTLETATLAYKP